MKKFTLHDGTELELSLTIGAIKKVKNAMGVDLTQPEAGDPPLIARMLDDDLLVAGIIEQLTGLNPDDMTAEDVLAGIDALLAEWTDFFRLRGRTERVQIISRTRQEFARVMKEVEEKIMGLGETSIDSPESSESSPTA